MSARHRQAAKRKRAEAAKVEAEQAAAITLAPGAPTTIFNWTVIGWTDATRKRIAVRCRCGASRVLAVSSLEDGSASRSCGACRVI
jgi:hypothetical protein